MARQAWKRHQMHMVPLQTMVDEAIEFIREYEPPEGYFVAFSGGKDSIVTLELVRMSGVKHQAFYSATGIDPPEVVKFIREHYSEVKFLRPKMTFWEGIQRNNPPTRWARWCCRILKEECSRHIDLEHRIFGLRSEESLSRAKRGQISYNKKLKQHEHKPIFGWKEYHVWEFIESNFLPYPSLYDEGWDRVGCVICPFNAHKNMARMLIHKRRWPKYFNTFEHAVSRWFNAKRLGVDDTFDTAEEYIQAWYRGFE